MNKDYANVVKKLLALLIICALTVSMMAACSADSSKETTPEGTTQSTETTGSTEKPDNGDTETPDNGDTEDPDNGDTETPDNGDTTEKPETYDEMVAYLQGKGFIAADATPVDMNATAGYLQTEVYDDTFQFVGYAPFSEEPVAFADIARDYDGLYLIWYDASENGAYAETWGNLKYALDAGDTKITYPLAFGATGVGLIPEMNANGSQFFIAFSEDYAQKDAVVAAFAALK